MSEKISYTEAMSMTVDELREVNFAMEYYDELTKEAIEKAKNE